jgi:hypothetical protein
MTYVKEVEEAYQEWVQARRAEGKLEGKHRPWCGLNLAAMH